ncbi:hypothetical protein BH11ARM1_BH11ARM1_08150 [soil metagenome]
MGYQPTLVWKSLRVSAGMACYQTKEIRLSRYVLLTEEQVRETLTHEYAHHLAVHRHGMKERAHGRGWKQAMIDLGVDPKVRHNFEVQRSAPRQKVVYKCSKCGLKIERSRRLRRDRVYMHNGCGGKVQLVEVWVRS